jgi:putative membrane protein
MRSSPTCSRFEFRAALTGTALAAGLAVLPMAAAAQMGNPGFMAAGTRVDKAGAPEPHQPNNTDVLFVQLVGEGGVAEVALADLAAGRTATKSVKAFAERMRTDHGDANGKLAGLAKDAGLAVPTQVNGEHAEMQHDLQGMDPAAFDLAYMRGQVVDHQKTVQLLEWEIGSGQEGSLQRFAAAVLPTVLDHLSMARGIVEELSPERVAAAPPARKP